MEDKLSLKTQHSAADEEITIDLREIWYLFLSKLKWLLVAALVGALVMALWSHFIKGPSYESTAKMYIVSASSDSLVNLSELQLSTNLTGDYKALMTSRPMLEEVISNLGLEEMKTEKLKKMISVANPSGTRILEIKATADDPVLSKRIANELMYVSKPWLADVMSSNEPNVIEEALAGKKITSTLKNAVIGGFVAAVLFFAFCVLQYLMNDTIRSADEFERYFGIVPLASVPDDDSMDDGIEDDDDVPNLLRKIKQLPLFNGKSPLKKNAGGKTNRGGRK